MMTVRLCSSISPSISLSVSIRPFVLYPSPWPHVLHVLLCTLVHPVVHWNLSYYNFLPLLSNSSLVWRIKVLLCACACMPVSGCLCIGGSTFDQATWRCLYKQRSPYCMVTSHCAQIGGPADRRPGRPAARPTATCQLNYNWHVSTD